MPADRRYDPAHRLQTNRMAVPKADLSLVLTTLFLRTHRVVHRRIPIGYGGSADSMREGE